MTVKLALNKTLMSSTKKENDNFEIYEEEVKMSLDIKEGRDEEENKDIPKIDIEPEYVSNKISLIFHPLMCDNSFKEKMQSLLNDHKKFRFTTRDGNCFYSSFLANYLQKENLEEKKEYFTEINLKYKELTKLTSVDEFFDALVFLFEFTKKEELNKASTFDFLSAITYLKILIHYELLSNSSFYESFLECSLTEFISSTVSPLYTDTENIHIQALANIAKVKINVYSVRTNNQGERNEFGEGGVVIDILNTPNHFEPIE
ncbi:hypothetical protein H312_01078 [Anncaliia algerae PRA339]|uniref:ubiquitinyl hydrolase 1 n=1 Tax=Anncaliia algerae PRA339 TaxID=1288291 RepID=A0A059F2T4_9MICR|nr:hypothetical protein H312_01078 [Anncaliia algerae PRA339]